MASFLTKFAMALLPSLRKDSVIEDLRITIKEIDDSLQDSFRDASEFFKINKPKSDLYKELSNTFYRNIKDKDRQDTILGEIYRRLPNLRANAVYIKDQLEILLEQDIIKEGLTAKKVLLIRGAGSIAFIVRYSLDLINIMYTAETKEAGNTNEDLELNKERVKFIEANIGKFAFLVADYAQDPVEFSRLVGTIPDVILNSKTAQAVQGVYGNKDIDPFANGYIQGFSGSPFLFFRTLEAEYQDRRYKENEALKKNLELRLLNLKLQMEKKPDPKLEQLIIHNQGRVDKLTRQIKEYETSIGLH
jgi:hypothetical protein